MFETWLNRLEKRVMRAMENSDPATPFSFEQFLAGCAKGYGAGVKLRYAMYRSGVFKPAHLDVPVISIGNLAVGGSGKTPMTVYLARMLVEKGLTPVVVSRGYRGSLGTACEVVGDGRDLFLDADVSGDEPLMMAMEKVFPVVAGKDREKAGRLAVETFAPDVILLDDGFQRLALARDLNLVLMDHEKPLGNRRLLPAGRLRETLAMARDRIDGVVFTRSPLPGGNPLGQTVQVQEILTQLGTVPVFYCWNTPFAAGYFPAGDREQRDFRLNEIKGKKVLLYSGLAGNRSFRRTVEDLGATIAEHLEFQDHYSYKKADFSLIQARAKKINADLILTTQKDWVKARPADFSDVDVAVIGIRLQFSDPNAFETFVLSKAFNKESFF